MASVTAGVLTIHQLFSDILPIFVLPAIGSPFRTCVQITAA